MALDSQVRRAPLTRRQMLAGMSALGAAAAELAVPLKMYAQRLCTD